MKTEEKNFIRLTDDRLFKETFGVRRNVKFLEDLLESYYGFKRGYLKSKLDVHYEEVLDKNDYFDKSIRCDLVVMFDSTFVNIEMYQIFNKESFIKSRYYVMRISSNQIEFGDTYKNIRKVTQINFIGEDKIGISEDIKSTISLGSDIEMNFIKLDKIKNNNYNEDNRFIKYLKLLNAASYKERDEIVEGDELLMELNEWVKGYCSEEEVKFFNDIYWNERIYRQDGIETVAKAMLKENYEIEEIVKLTKLTKEEVASLKEN